jgi:hypothetical protein
MGRACSTNGETRTAYRILAGKPEGKRPLGRLRRKRMDNIKVDKPSGSLEMLGIS